MWIPMSLQMSELSYLSTASHFPCCSISYSWLSGPRTAFRRGPGLPLPVRVFFFGKWRIVGFNTIREEGGTQVFHLPCECFRQKHACFVDSSRLWHVVCARLCSAVRFVAGVFWYPGWSCEADLGCLSSPVTGSCPVPQPAPRPAPTLQVFVGLCGRLYHWSGPD